VLTDPTIPAAPPAAASPRVAGTAEPPGTGGAGAPLGVPPALDAALVAPACANCGAALVGPYCAQCGQRAASRLLSVRYIVQDALEDQLSLDGSLPRTGLALLLHPGRLTREYIAGRVRSYLPPMRLYLTCSVVFFLVLAFVAGPARLASDAPAGSPGVTVASAPAGHASQSVNITVGPRAEAQGGVPVGGIVIDTLHGPKWLRDRMAAQARHFQGMPPRDAVKELLGRLYNAAPKVAFVLLPLFALILKGLYIRRRRLYVEHFVFALHVHAAAFLAFTVMLLARNGYVGIVLTGWLVFYFFHALRVVYGQGWLRTLAKMTLLGFAYFLVLCAGIIGGTVVAILTD